MVSSGCGERKTNVKIKQSIPLEVDNLINWEYFNDAGRHNVSFPLWFNEEVVLTDSISTVEMSVYRFQENQGNKKLLKDTFPDETWRFTFNADGFAETVVLREFAEAIPIAIHEFEYKSNPDSLGFSSPIVSTRYLFKRNKSSLQGIFDQVEDLKVFNRLVFNKQDSIGIYYENALSTLGEKHVFLKDSSTWNVRFIDQNFKANGKNYYYYGLPKSYVESFKLDNLVEKTTFQRREYYPNQVICKQEFHSGGFYHLRTFNYDSTGWCLNLQDSIYSDSKEFVYAEKTAIEYNEDNLPKGLYVYALSDTSKRTPKKRYEISYSPTN
jgi:hypothetical protein